MQMHVNEIDVEFYPTKPRAPRTIIKTLQVEFTLVHVWSEQHIVPLKTFKNFAQKYVVQTMIKLEGSQELSYYQTRLKGT